MNTKRIIKTGTSTTLSFALLKAFRNSADPYTRIAIGGSLSLVAFAFAGREIGLGVGFGSLLQGTEISQGGRITKNEYQQTIYTLHEDKGVKELVIGTLPNYNCDGFTFNGLNGVYKISDGVHCQIYKNGSVNFSGLGALVNKAKNGGFHNYDWCVKTKDSRWLELYAMSLQ